MFNHGVRPMKYHFRTFLHLENQFLLSSNTEKWTWPERSRSETYKTRFIVRAMEVVKKRNKPGKEACIENWKDYDNFILKEFKNESGCNNPYQPIDKELPTCDTQEKMKRSKFYLGIVDERRYKKPCNTMESLRVEWVESDTEKSDDTDKFGEFWFSIQFYLGTFKEIIHAR